MAQSKLLSCSVKFSYLIQSADSCQSNVSYAHFNAKNGFFGKYFKFMAHYRQYIKVGCNIRNKKKICKIVESIVSCLLLLFLKYLTEIIYTLI